MNGLNVTYIGIFVQSFAVFVALTTLLGRIYSLTYFEFLGIPASEISLKITDYSVISPDVTIFGVGFSTIIAIQFLFHKQSASTSVPLRTKFVWVLVLAGLGTVLLLVAFRLLVQQPQLNSVLSVLSVLIALTLFLIAGSILGSRPASDSSTDKQTIAIQNILMPLFATLILVFSAWIITEFCSTIARVDAWHTLAEAPQAKIELASSSAHDELRIDSNDSNTDFLSLDRLFRVIHVGERFIYVRPLDLESPQENLYALPVGDIVSIAYVSGGKGQ